MVLASETFNKRRLQTPWASPALQRAANRPPHHSAVTAGVNSTNMISTFPKKVALKAQGNIRWLILVWIVLLGFMIGTSPKEQGEVPNLFNAISSALFSFWFFVSFSIVIAVSYFKKKPEVPVSSFWVQVTSSNWYVKLSSSSILSWLDKKWSQFAYLMFLLIFYAMGLFGLFTLFFILYGYSEI